MEDTNGDGEKLVAVGVQTLDDINAKIPPRCGEILIPQEGRRSSPARRYVSEYGPNTEDLCLHNRQFDYFLSYFSL